MSGRRPSLGTWNWRRGNGSLQCQDAGGVPPGPLLKVQAQGGRWPPSGKEDAQERGAEVNEHTQRVENRPADKLRQLVSEAVAAAIVLGFSLGLSLAVGGMFFDRLEEGKGWLWAAAYGLFPIPVLAMLLLSWYSLRQTDRKLADFTEGKSAGGGDSGYADWYKGD